MVKRTFADQDTVIALDSGRFYKAKILKGAALRSSWQYFVHYDQWNIKYDKWVDEDALRAYSGKLKDIKIPLRGLPVSSLQQKLKQYDTEKESTAATENVDASSATTAAPPAVPVETEEQARKRRKVALSQNLFVVEPLLPGIDDTAVAASSSSSKQSILIPGLLKKYLVDDWSNISVETCVPPPDRIGTGTGAAIVAPYTKLLRLPRPHSVSTIISMFLEHKYAATVGAGAEPDESAAGIYQSCLEAMTGLRSYFNSALPAILLYRQEREHLDAMRARVREHNREHGASMQFVPANVYGAEHLVRLCVKLPGYLNTHLLLSQQQEHNKLIQRINELLKFMVKNSGQFFGHIPVRLTGSASSAAAQPVVVHSMREQAYSPAKDALQECAQWDPSSLIVPRMPAAVCLPVGSGSTARSTSDSPSVKYKAKSSGAQKNKASPGKGQRK